MSDKNMGQASAIFGAQRLTPEGARPMLDGHDPTRLDVPRAPRARGLPGRLPPRFRGGLHDRAVRHGLRGEPGFRFEHSSAALSRRPGRAVHLGRSAARRLSRGRDGVLLDLARRAFERDHDSRAGTVCRSRAGRDRNSCDPPANGERLRAPRPARSPGGGRHRAAPRLDRGARSSFFSCPNAPRGLARSFSN